MRLYFYNLVYFDGCREKSFSGVITTRETMKDENSMVEIIDKLKELFLVERGIKLASGNFNITALNLLN